MTTYLLLNLIFFVTAIMFLPKQLKKPGRAWLVTLIVLCILTAIFDPILIFLHVYGYTPSKLLGIHFFGAPIEDFFYALYAACIVPLVWNRIGERNETYRK